MVPPSPVLGPKPGLPACSGHCLALARRTGGGGQPGHWCVPGSRASLASWELGSYWCGEVGSLAWL